MTMDRVFQTIDRYLKRKNGSTFLVDVQNRKDMDTLATHYQLPQNTFLAASAFCHPDAFPDIAALMARLQQENRAFFVQEISTFYFLRGESALKQTLAELLSLDVAGHAVFLTWQCRDYLTQMMHMDRRLQNRICIVEGTAAVRPKLVFSTWSLNIPAVHGLHQLAGAVEAETADTIYIETKKSRKDFPSSLYVITDMNDPYEVLCRMDPADLKRSFGSQEDWQYALRKFDIHPSWDQLLYAEIGNTNNLSSIISEYSIHKSDPHWLWLYWIGLKLFGADWYLNAAAQNSDSVSDFFRAVYRSILEISPDDERFAEAYTRRKAILNAIENPGEEAADFCKIVLSREQDAIYYLTDNTVPERELLFRLLDQYGQTYDRQELMEILKMVYPDLYHYMESYPFHNELLDSYFQDYKYQKLINKIMPEFMEVVNQQAESRDYISILEPRSAVLEGIDQTDAQTYFTDAMGVEYLGFILSRCHDLSMFAKVTVCRCDLPSITCCNKGDFWDSFSSEQYPIRSVSELDELKHHGKYNSDYSKTKLPIHLMKELEIIDQLLKKIQEDLAGGKTYSKAILISDHGASRLAVIHETENLLEMEESGNHSGRCCPKSETDQQPDHAVDAGEFWALANYDRFRGSRKANVEVHGGAALEEVAVPIIELTYLRGEIEIKLMPLDAPPTLTGIPEIKTGHKKPAAVKIYISQRLMDISISIDGHSYSAVKIDDNSYVVKEMPEIRRAGLYDVNVFSCGNQIGGTLQLSVKHQGMSEKNIF